MFIKEIPVWAHCPTGLTLNIAAIDLYRLIVNGEFVGWRQARNAKGYDGVDSCDPHALTAKNVEPLYLEMSHAIGNLCEYRDGKGGIERGFAFYISPTLPFADRVTE